MSASKDTGPKRRFRDLGELARQANHVVAAAVLVFMASILLQYVLSRPMMHAAGWIHRHWGVAGAAILGPIITDGCTTLVLLAVAFPFGRVTAARPWPAAVGLVLLVHGFWLSFHFVVGEHKLLWGHAMPVVGRSVLMLLTLFGVMRLLRRGRQVALEADGLGKPRKDAGSRPAKKSSKGEEGAGAVDPGPDGEGGAGAGDPGPKGEEDHDDPADIASETKPDGSERCKDEAKGDVSGGER